MTTITQTITTLPAAPDPATDSPATFSTKAAATVLAQKDMVTELQTLIPQINTVASEIIVSAETVTTQAALADAAAVLATTEGDIQVWVSGATYVIGDKRWDPADGLSYRRRTNGAGTTNPNADPTNWWKITNTIFDNADVSGVMFKNCGYTYVDKGDSGTASQAIDISAGSHQRIRTTGSFSISFLNWAPSGNSSWVIVDFENDGTARVITFPDEVVFLTSTGAESETFPVTTELQSVDGQIDRMIFWSVDEGAKVVCKVVR